MEIVLEKLGDKAEALVYTAYIKKLLKMNPYKYGPLVNDLIKQLLLINQLSVNIDNLHLKKIKLTEETEEVIKKMNELNKKGDELQSLIKMKFPIKITKDVKNVSFLPLEKDIFNDSVAPTPQKLNKKLKPRRIFLEIMPVTEEEYKTIPKYMLLSLKLAEINEFIDKLNEVFKTKHSLESKKFNNLKREERILYLEYKNKESPPTLQGSTWITEANIASAFQLKRLDKRRLCITTVLRHLKKLSEKYCKNERYYILI